MDIEPVLIVGAGLAGLSCAAHLRRRKIPYLVIEASDAPGGRIRTDSVNGFKLDRGFQVLLNSYPEAKEQLDFRALKLGFFKPGALIRHNGKFHRVSDPFRDPASIFDTLSSPIGSPGDKLKIAKLVAMSAMNLDEQKDCSTIELLREIGFSTSMIGTFFKPFFGGVFLENELSTSSKNFRFLFKMFSTGFATLPAEGMEAIPKQLSREVGYDKIRLNSRVQKIAGNNLILQNGERYSSNRIVIAIDGAYSTLLSESELRLPKDPERKSTSCIYFSSKQAPIDEPMLVLNGDGAGLINNLCVPNLSSPSYAPEGNSLISVTVLGNPAMTDKDLEEQVQTELVSWFGKSVQEWQHLRTYRIPNALPVQSASDERPDEPYVQLREGLYACGDRMGIASINTAMRSGRLVAENIAAKLSTLQSSFSR